MPEGDSIAGDAERLRPALVGRVIVAVAGSSGSVRSHAGRIRGCTVEGIRTKGKNLLVDFSSGYSLHVHLGMNGRWRLVEAGKRFPGAARVVLSTADTHAACVGAPTVEVDRTPAVEIALGRLGPDLLGGTVDYDEVIRRARSVHPSTPLGTVLLDQTVAAGIGNVYKSELAFRARINPMTPIGRVDDTDLRAIYEDASELFLANVGPTPRSTTGDRGRGKAAWVYGGEGLGCRVCSTPIAAGRLDDRVTFWCPRCQPDLS